ncbi:gluconokinase [Planctomycetota bacterium]|nr:gluconokinase [Planctomycetota bacterium]
MNPIRHIILMGVCGSGKTIIGKELSHRIGWPFVEGDLFHNKSNIAKMRNGEALTTPDRIPWLERLNAELIEYEQAEVSVILSCSALKYDYRHILATNLVTLPRFVYLKVSEEEATIRLQKRNDHFMPVSLIHSQFEALEEPTKEDALHIVADEDVESVIQHIIVDLI